MRIVTASDDKSVRVWNARTGAPLKVLNGHASFVDVVAFSLDGTRIVSSSDDGTARIWASRALEAGDPFAIACVSLGNTADMGDLAQRYGLAELKPICGSNAPSKINLSDIRD